jgi:hypothetical protein
MMEGAMLRIRIVSAGVALTAATLFVANPALAQTNLLAGLKPPSEHHAMHAGTHTKAATKKTATRAVHRKHHTVVAAKATPSPAEPNQIAPLADTTPVAAATATADAAAPPSPASSHADDTLTMKAVVVDGQTVPIASPDEANAIDLAADRAAKTDTAKPDAANAPIVQADAAPVVRTVYAAPISKHEAQSSPIGSAAWIAQVLAALGGAVTAGVVAWFLIGGGPARMYG